MKNLDSSFQQFIGIYSKSNMTTGHKKC